MNDKKNSKPEEMYGGIFSSNSRSEFVKMNNLRNKLFYIIIFDIANLIINSVSGHDRFDTLSTRFPH